MKTSIDNKDSPWLRDWAGLRNCILSAFLYTFQYLLIVLGSQLKVLIYLPRKFYNSYKEAFKLENAFKNNANNNNNNKLWKKKEEKN